MAGQRRDACTLSPTRRGTRSRPARAAAIALAALLAACTAATPSGSPPAATPGLASPPATTPATATPTSADVPSAAPSPDAGAWRPIGAVPAQPVAAELTPVAGSSYAMDAGAGFRLRATGDVPLATLLERLRVEPALAYRPAVAADGRSAVLVPAEPLRPGAAFRFTLVDPAGAPVTGWAFQTAGPPRVVATIPYDEATDVPVDTGVEVTFDRDGVAVGRDDLVVRLLPERTRVAGRIEMHGRAAVFVPARKLLSGRAYEVTLRAGTGSTDVLPGLDRAVVFAFQVQPARKPGGVRATLEAPFFTSLPGERAVIAAQAWQDGEDGGDEASTPIRVRVYRLRSEAAALDALARLAATPGWAGYEARPVVATKGLALAFSGRATWTPAGYGRRLLLPRATARGWYLVELREGAPSQAVLQVTDVVGIIAARDDRLLAWVNDASTGRPVKGSSIAVVDGPALGRSDERGVLLARTPAAVRDARGTVLVRMSAPGSRRVIVQLTGPSGVERNEWALVDHPDRDAWWAAFSIDRWLYRPTDTVSAWGYLRRRDGRVASTVELRLRRDAYEEAVGQPIAVVTARRAATGAFVAEVPLVDLPHGSYRLQLVADGRVVETGSFAVGDIRKPAYRLEVDAARLAVTAGTPIAATVTARFYDDTPAAAVPVAVDLSFDEDDGSVARGATGTDGRAEVTVPTTVERPLQYDCRVLAARPDGPAEGDISANREACIFRGSELVDVEATPDGATVVLAGAVHEVDLPAVERWLRSPDDEDRGDLPRGAAVAGRRVDLTITETQYRKVLQSTWYDPITKRVAESWELEEVGSSATSHHVTTAADGRYRLALPAPGENRSWQVRATIRDASGAELSETTWLEDAARLDGSWSYDVRIRGDSGVSIGATVTAEIVRNEHGDRARPVAAGGRDRFLFAIASPSRLAAAVSRTPSARTRFGAADEPNLTFTAVWFTGRAYVMPGEASASLRTDDRRLTVAVSLDRARYAPGATATVAVRTTDPGGRPVRASVVLRGIDEKLVAMGTAALDDPLEELYAARPVGFVAGPAASHRLDVVGDDGKATGGGGGNEGARADFRDVLSLRLVTTGADGRARIEIPLPDDVTSWRIGLAALTAKRQAGTASVLVPVGLPFFVDATVAPEYLAGDRVGIRLRTYGSELTRNVPVRYAVSSASLGMSPKVVNGRALDEAVVMLPALDVGTHRVTIQATSAAGRDRIVRTFRVVDSRLTASRRESRAIVGPVTPPGGPGVTRLVLVDSGRARYADRLLGLVVPGGQRADERLAAEIARDLLVEELGVPAAQLPAGVRFDRSVYQGEGGGLALLPYASADLELTVRALVARPSALLADPARAWLRYVADAPGETAERHAVALAGLAALGEPVLDRLGAALADRSAGGRTHLWAALGLALLGDREGAAAVERSLLARWGEQRGDLLRLRISDDAEEVTEATELLALLAAWVDDPRADEALAYVASVPPRDDLAVLAEVGVIGRLVARLPAATAGADDAVVAVVQDGRRSTVRIPSGGAAVLEIVAAQRAGLRLEPVSGSATVVASWEEPVGSVAALGSRDPDLALTRTISPEPPVPANAYVIVRLQLRVSGPGRDGSVEVVDLVPSGLAAMDVESVTGDACGPYGVSPSRIEGQRVIFVAAFSARRGVDEDEGDAPTVPGTFCLAYQARVVTAGTYAWEPAVARQAASPGLVATTPAGSVVLR